MVGPLSYRTYITITYSGFAFYPVFINFKAVSIKSGKTCKGTQPDKSFIIFVKAIDVVMRKTIIYIQMGKLVLIILCKGRYACKQQVYPYQKQYFQFMSHSFYSAAIAILKLIVNIQILIYKCL